MVAIRPTKASALNTSHALAGRLIHGYVFSEGSGTTRNIVQTSASTTLQTGATWVSSGGNSYVRTNPGGIEAGITTVVPQAPFHIVVGYRDPTNSTEPQQTLFSNTLDGGSTYTQAAAPFFWFYDGTGSWNIDGNAYYANAATGSQSSWSDAPASVYAAGVHHLHLAVTATESTLYRNGVSLGTSAKVVPGTTAQPIRFGVGHVTNYQNFRADFDYVYIFQGSLTQTEIDDLRTDPYALVVPLSTTRFYLPTTGTAAISPAFDAAWNDNSSVVPRPANTTKGTSAFAEITDVEISTSNAWDVALGQFISEPLAAQTISGNAVGYIRSRESNAGANARSQMVIRVVSGDGATVRGTLLAQSTDITNVNEWVATTTTTAARNARVPRLGYATTLTPVAVQAGDRLVIEVGGRAVNTVSTSYTLGMWFGENAADLAANETGTTQGAPWVEFDSAIQFFSALSPHVVSGGVTSPKPTITATATQTFPARAVTGTISAKKPTVAGTAVQVFPARSVNGAITAIKPTIAATSTQTSIARSATGAIAAPKPSIAATATQTFPARTVAGAIAVTKPTISAAAVQVFPARTVVGTVAAKKPTLTATAVSSRLVSGALTAPKPSATAVATQTFPTRAVTGSFAAKKPTLSGTAVQVIPSRALVAALSAPKPTLTAIATVSAGSNSSFSPGFNSGFGFSSPVRNLAAALIAPKPSLSGATVQVFPARSLAAVLAAAKPTISAAAVQTFPSRAVTGALGAKKPNLAATAAQVFPARNVAGAVTAKKPEIAGAAVQVFPARSVTAALAVPKPAMAGTATQTFPTRNLAAALLAPKPTLTATLFQSQIGQITISSALAAPKPTITATATQVFPARSVGGLLAAPKPTLRAFVTETRRVAATLSAPKPSITATAVQAAVGSVSVTGVLAAKKPTMASTATQVFPARDVSGTVAAKKPMLTASAVHPLPPHDVAADLAAPKPTAAGALTQNFPERLILGNLAATKPSIAGGIIQVFPERFVSAALGVPKPTIRGTMVRGVSQEAPELSNAVYLTGSVNPEVRFQGTFDLDVPFVAAIETDVFLTGTIDN